MVLRRIPGRNLGTKLSTFGLIMLAGIEELAIINKQRISGWLNENVYLLPKWSRSFNSTQPVKQTLTARQRH
jgi:hypothetical protein